jgi:hypothetical protein
VLAPGGITIFSSAGACMNILDKVLLQLPCGACGGSYEIPLSDILLSHNMVHSGCPVPQETECLPVFQIRLFDLRTIRKFEKAWQDLAERAQLVAANLS